MSELQQPGGISMEQSTHSALERQIIGNYIYISFLTDGHDPNEGDENPDDGRTPRMDVVRMRHSPVSEFC